jgi:hypothetical protein
VSGTELSRLMAEVTAQPPIDVDFAAVQGQVRRRRRRLQGAASATIAIVVAVAIAVQASLSGGGSTTAEKKPGEQTPGELPTSATAAVDSSSWATTNKYGLSWRTPPGWHVLDVKPVLHSEPAGVPNALALLSPTSLPSTCADPDKVSSCLLRLPDDGVFAQVISGGGYGRSADSSDSGTVTAASDQCHAMGAARSFTSLRAFGSQPYTVEVQVTACLGKSAAGTAPSLLRAVVASLADSEAVTVDASWHEAGAGRLRWTMPPGWIVGEAAGAATVVIDTGCPTAHSGDSAWSCTPAIPQLRPDQGFVWVSALAPHGSPLVKTKYNGGQPAAGACAAAGGRYDTIDQRDLGPNDAGEVLVLSGCLGPSLANRSATEIRLVLDRIRDTTYADPHQLCSSIPGTAVSSELATVAQIRGLKWGDAHPAAALFPRAKATDQAAWCWIRDPATQEYDVWAARAGDAPVKVVSLTTAMYRGNYTPSGAPYSPPVASLAPGTQAGQGTSADSLCAAVLGSHVSAWPDTVGGIRQASWGTSSTPPLAAAFPGASDIDTAAWCWQDDNGTYKDWAVHTGDKPFLAVTTTNVPQGSVPAGPPLFP